MLWKYQKYKLLFQGLALVKIGHEERGQKLFIWIIYTQYFYSIFFKATAFVKKCTHNKGFLWASAAKFCSSLLNYNTFQGVFVTCDITSILFIFQIHFEYTLAPMSHGVPRGYILAPPLFCVHVITLGYKHISRGIITWIKCRCIDNKNCEKGGKDHFSLTSSCLSEWKCWTKIFSRWMETNRRS